MSHRANQYLIHVVLLGLMMGCSSEEGLTPFTSDGCSLFPDASLINNDDWCACCVEHDVAYWQGGTRQQREAADMELKQCVLKKTQDEMLANVMHEGVRFGGSPYFYNWYRWGYGWSYERKYQELTASERKQVQLLLAKYYSSNESICER